MTRNSSMCGVLLVAVAMLGCRPPYSPRTTPVDDDNTLPPDVFTDRYAASGPPKLVVAPAFDLQLGAPDSVTVAAEVHANVPKLLAITGYAGYGVYGNSKYRVEGYAGFPLFKGTSYVVGGWALSQSRTIDTVTTKYKRVNIPVHTMLVVEGGFRLQAINFTGTGNGELSSSPVGFFRVGLRRKTFWSVNAGGDTARSMASWWLHAVLPPVGVPEPAMGSTLGVEGLLGGGEAASRPVGGAFGMEFPAWLTSKVLFRTEVAYLPGPQSFEFMFGASYLFEVF